MKLPAQRWPDTDLSRGMLFFTQTIKDLLSRDTFESYRAFSLATPARLTECIQLCREEKKGRVAEAAVKPALDEASWSIKRDPVYQECFSEIELGEISQRISGQSTLDEKIKTLKYCLKIKPIDYKLRLEENIKRAIDDPNKRIYLYATIIFYVSFLINIGYRRSYIERVNETQLFAQNIIRTKRGKLDSIFNKFDLKEKKFIVVGSVGNNFAKIYKDISIHIFRPNELTHPCKDLILRDLPISGANVYFMMETTSLDEESAVRTLNKLLGYFRSLALLNPQAPELSWSNKMFVSKPRAKNGIILDIEVSSPLWRVTRDKVTKKMAKSIHAYSRKVLKNFDDESGNRILESISVATSVNNLPSFDSQITAIWSAYEILMADKAVDISGISYYRDNILPCICVGHIREKFIYMSDQMNAMYRKKYVSVVHEVEDFDGAGDHVKLAALICFPEYEDQRRQLCEVSSNNPLALQKLFRLHKDYGGPNKAIVSARNHKRRVEWQIYRIYRARNSIVHAGLLPLHPEAVLINAGEYYRSSIVSIVRMADQETMESNLHDVIHDLGIYYNICMRHIEKLAKAELDFSRPIFEKMMWVKS